MEEEDVIISVVVGIIAFVFTFGAGGEVVDGILIAAVAGVHNYVHQYTILFPGEDFKREGEKEVVDKMDHDSFLLEWMKWRATMRRYKLPSHTVPSW